MTTPTISPPDRAPNLPLPERQGSVLLRDIFSRPESTPDQAGDQLPLFVVTTGLSFVIDGGGSVVTTGEKGHVEIPFDCIITAARIVADQSGSIVVDIWRDSYANFPPTNADTITGGNEPTLSSAQSAEDTTLTDWLVLNRAGDWLAFNVDSATTVQRVTVSLTLRKFIR